MNRDDRKVCRHLVLIAIFVVLAGAALAADHPRLPAGITCPYVRAKVAQYGERVAYAWAKLQGYSAAQINEAMRCLK